MRTDTHIRLAAWPLHQGSSGVGQTPDRVIFGHALYKEAGVRTDVKTVMKTVGVR